MNTKTKGALAAVLAAFIFGFTPILGRISYDGGSNATMLTFLRSFLALPILFVIIKLSKISLSLTTKNWRDLILMGVFGSTATTLTLYESYNYIPVGMATLIHFTYPSFVVIYSVAFLKEKMTRGKTLCLLLSTVGLLLFCDISGGGQLQGFVLALISAITFAFVMIFQYRSSLINFHPFKISFYQCCITSSVMFFFGLITENLTLTLTNQAWFYSFLVAICVSIAALSLTQIGLQYIGSTAVSVLSLFEPITSVVVGVLVLKEDFSLEKLFGCVLVLLAVLSFTLSEKSNKI